MENPSSATLDVDAEIIPEDYPTYDASFKIIVIGDQGKKNFLYKKNRSWKIVFINSSNKKYISK